MLGESAQDLAQNGAVQEAMQIMFGQDNSFMPPALDSQAQDQQDMMSNKPAMVQRLSVLARSPADAPSLRPFNMLGIPGTANDSVPLAQYTTQSDGQAGYDDGPGSFLPQASSPEALLSGSPAAGMSAQVDPPRLSMAGMVAGAGSTNAAWLASGAAGTPSLSTKAAKKSRKRSMAASAKQPDLGDAHQIQYIAETGSGSQDWSSQQSSMQAEFSFSPMRDGGGRIQDLAFSPLAAGAGQIHTRPSIGQRIRRSLFGPTKDTAPSSEAKLAKVGGKRCQSKAAHAVSSCHS